MVSLIFVKLCTQFSGKVVSEKPSSQKCAKSVSLETMRRFWPISRWMRLVRWRLPAKAVWKIIEPLTAMAMASRLNTAFTLRCPISLKISVRGFIRFTNRACGRAVK